MKDFFFIPLKYGDFSFGNANLEIPKDKKKQIQKHSQVYKNFNDYK